LRDRDGVNYGVTVTFSGAEATTSNATVQDVINAINAQIGAKFSASLVSGQIQVEELNKSQRSLRALASFIETNTNTGAASVSNISFSQTTRTIRQDTVGVITSGTLLTDASVGIGTGFDTGESFDIELRANDGTIQTVQYTIGSPADTYQDLANFITSNTDFTASIVAGELRISEDTLTEGSSLRLRYLNYAGLGTLNNPGSVAFGDTIATANGTFGGSYTTATLLNSLPNFTNVQQGDELLIRLTDNSGVTQNVNFTFAGAASGASTSTVADLINAINAQTTLNAFFDSDINEIVIEDPSNLGSTIALSISNADFTELARPLNGGINLSFSYSGEEMISNVLQTGGVNVTAATRLTDIDGWGTMEGNDRIRINLRTRAGATANFDFIFNDVASGVTSNRTVGDLVTYISGRTIGAVNFNASLSGGQILIEEENSPQISLNGSSVFTENNIDESPKQFTNSQFQINQFLRLASDTGLVIGLGLIDFDSGTPLTQRTASQLLQNVDDSINRVNDQLNEIGILQSRLSNRETSLRQSIISNESARSRLRDTDFAKSYSSFLRAQILQRYQTVSLTQANLSPVSVLGLL
jgi:flagellin-like hook-associated protein FlgL